MKLPKVKLSKKQIKDIKKAMHEIFDNDATLIGGLKAKIKDTLFQMLIEKNEVSEMIKILKKKSKVKKAKKAVKKASKKKVK